VSEILSKSEAPSGEQLIAEIKTALDEVKAVDTVVLDVRKLSSVMDYLVISSGTSSRHVKSLAENVVVELKKQGVAPIGSEGEGPGEWVLVDYGDVVLHVMQPAVRSFYDLERLWTAVPGAAADVSTAPEDVSSSRD
jgi:ribosome-associated protein